MIHARKDYNRFQDPALKDPKLLGENSTPIAEDEPVFLLRAKDFCAPEAVRAYARLLMEVKASHKMIAAVGEWANRMQQWQMDHQNVVKVPDVPEGMV